MNKINFENAPSANTPLSAGILNQMQDNIEDALNGKIESYYVITNDSKFDDVSQIIGEDYQDDKVYAITNSPISDENYIQNGSTHTVLGCERVNKQYGYQLSLSYNDMMFRTKFDGVWGFWSKVKKDNYIQTGVEFETGRYIDGEKEYGKILSIGTIPNNTSETYYTGLDSFGRYTYVDGYTSNAWGVKFVPQKINDSSIVLTQEGDKLRVQTWTSTYADANYQGYIEIHYLKH